MADNEIEFVKSTKKCRFSDLPNEYFFRYKGRLFVKVEQCEDGCNAILANSAAFKDFSCFCFDDNTEVVPALNILKVEYRDYSCEERLK